MQWCYVCTYRKRHQWCYVRMYINTERDIRGAMYIRKYCVRQNGVLCTDVHTRRDIGGPIHQVMYIPWCT